MTEQFSQIERCAALELRAAGALEFRVKGRLLEGYAAVFGQNAEIGGFTERIARGAFSKSLTSRADILGLVDHDAGRILARTRSGTLRLKEDGFGLAFEIDVPDTTLGNDVLALAKRGDLGGMSFGFRAAQNGETWVGKMRELRSVDLVEVSVVGSFPAYSGTTVQARARSGPDAAARRALARLRMELL